jgi:hypothetical protein
MSDHNSPPPSSIKKGYKFKVSLKKDEAEFKLNLLYKILRNDNITYYIPPIYYNEFEEILMENIKIDQITFQLDQLYNTFYEFYKIIDTKIEHYGEQFGIIMPDNIKEMCIHALWISRKNKKGDNNDIKIIASYYEHTNLINKKKEQLKDDFIKISQKLFLHLSEDNINKIIAGIEKKENFLTYELTDDKFINIYKKPQLKSLKSSKSDKKITYDEFNFTLNRYIKILKFDQFITSDYLNIYKHILFYNLLDYFKDWTFGKHDSPNIFIFEITSLLITSYLKFYFILKIVPLKLIDDGYDDNPSNDIKYALINELWNKDDNELNKIIFDYNKRKTEEIRQSKKEEKKEEVQEQSLKETSKRTSKKTLPQKTVSRLSILKDLVSSVMKKK